MAAPEHQTELSPSTAQLPPAQFWFRRLLSLIAVFGGIIAVQYWMVPNMPTSYDVRLIVLGLLFAVLAVSLNLINGITGQFSIGHAAFYLIGAYTTARLTLSFFHVQPFQDGVWLLLMMVVGGVAAGIAGFIVGLPSLRLRGDYLAIVTLGFGEIARIIVINQQGGASAFWGLDLGGAFGLIQIPRITTLGYVVLLLVFTVLVSRNLLKTSHGLTFLAVREDETAAEATGVNTTRTKVTAFVIGAALAGMAGALFAHFEGFIQPLHFDMTVSFIILTMVVIGGTGSITGAAVAGFSITLLQEGLRELGDIGAIDLIGYIIAAVLIIIALGVMRRRTSLLALPTVKKGLTVVGLLACVLTILAAYRLWGLDVSVVVRACVLLIILGGMAALLLSTAGRRGMPGFGLLAAAAAAGALLKVPIAAGLHQIPLIETSLRNTEYSPGHLRMAVFAFALVIVMLSRPQGLFGHHEFSWDFVKRCLGLKQKETAVST